MMRGMRSGILSMAVILTASAASAQAIPAGPGQSAPIDLAVTYDAFHTNHLIWGGLSEFWGEVAFKCKAKLETKTCVFSAVCVLRGIEAALGSEFGCAFAPTLAAIRPR
jgi:hypothetical protein